MRGDTRALRLHCLRHDAIESAGAGSSTLLSGVLFALFGALVVAAMAEGEPALLFALLGLFALVDAFGDVAGVLLDPRDLPLLRTLPIAPRDYVRARFGALLVPISVKTLALGVPVVAALLGRGRGLRAAAAFLLSFAAMELALAASAALLLLLFRRAWSGWRLHATLAWLRALLLVGATAGWLLLFTGEPGDRAASGVWDSAALPTTWFAELFAVVGGLGGADAAVRWGRVVAALAMLAAGAAGIALLARSYVPLLESIERAAPPKARAAPPWRRAFERWFVARAERPTFRLGIALLRRERTFRLQTLPLLAYPLLFLWLGRGADDGGLLALLFAQFPAVALALCRLFLRFSDSPAGGFALRFASDAASARPLESGGRKAMWFALALPLSVIVAALLAADRGLAFGVGVGAVGLLSSTFGLLGGAFPIPELPFVARFRGRIDSNDSGEGGRVFGLLLVLILAAAIEWRVVRLGAAASVLLAVIALAATAFLLRRSVRSGGSRDGKTSSGEGIDFEPMVDPIVVAASVPAFPIRLRREVRGLAVFFALTGLLLTAFFAWI